MKKSLLFTVITFLLITITTNLFAQTIFVAGNFSSPAGTNWNTDYDFSTATGSLLQAQSVYMVAGSREMKFTNPDWTRNWGDGSSTTVGNVVTGSVVVNPAGNHFFTVPTTGFYDVVFDSVALTYSMTLSSYTAAANNFRMYASGDNINNWSTGNRMVLVGNNQWQTAFPATLAAGGALIKFRNDINWAGTDWGGTQPAPGLSGTAVIATGGGPNINYTITTAGLYNISFNDLTLAYSITPVSGTPVTLVSISAKRSGGAVILNWQTATEINNDHFTIERSPDGIHFSKITDIAGSGSNTGRSYTYTDTDPLSYANYYRLNDVDMNGRVTTSKIVFVNFVNDQFRVAVFPNPASDHVSIRFNANNKSTTSIQIVDINGRVLRKITATVLPGKNEQVFTITDIPKGLYTVKMDGAVKTFIKK